MLMNNFPNFMKFSAESVRVCFKKLCLEDLEKNCEKARSTPTKLKISTPKNCGFAADFACGFFEF